ncbi:hypothetical protein [Corynebacterium cystitidis]|uniref:hypothetical protein n=1 Tax=Corynebacterium cystitidis TaxID=35757 RepID=UPI00211F4601|nr:hypothetical protein [Corynebacterium cystitidis]
MSKNKLFADTDDWFAQRGLTRKGTRQPYWVKDFGPDFQFVLHCDPIKLSDEVYETRFGYLGRFPSLEKLHVALHDNSSVQGKPTGVLRATGVRNSAFHGLRDYGYNPLEASGRGPLWDSFLAKLGPGLELIEQEITQVDDFRTILDTASYWDVSTYPMAEMFNALHLHDWDEAERLLEATDWHHKINPQNIRAKAGKLTTDEEVTQIKNLITAFIATHRKED